MSRLAIDLIIGLGTPLFPAIIAGVTWYLKTNRDEIGRIDERAHEKRIKIYKEILSPLIVMLTNGATPKEKEDAKRIIGSVKYKESAFNLIIFGSDEMVNSYNEMMQSF